MNTPTRIGLNIIWGAPPEGMTFRDYLASPFTREWWAIRWEELPVGLWHARLAITLVLLLSISDLLTTKIALSMGFTEKIPTMAMLIAISFNLACFIKMFVTGVLVVFSVYLKRVWLLWFMVAILGIIALANSTATLLTMFGYLAPY